MEKYMPTENTKTSSKLTEIAGTIRAESDRLLTSNKMFTDRLDIVLGRNIAKKLSQVIVMI